MKKSDNKNKDYLKILKYFSNIKGWLFGLVLIMVGYIFTNAFISIVTAKLVTSLTDFSITNAISLAVLFLILSLFQILFRKLTDIVFFKKINSFF